MAIINLLKTQKKTFYPNSSNKILPLNEKSVSPEFSPQ